MVALGVLHRRRIVKWIPPFNPHRVCLRPRLSVTFEPVIIRVTWKCKHRRKVDLQTSREWCARCLKGVLRQYLPMTHVCAQSQREELTMMLERVLFGNRMTMSVIVMCMPDMQLKEGVLMLFVILGPCIFAASYPPRTSDPSNLAFEVAPSSPHQYP